MSQILVHYGSLSETITPSFQNILKCSPEAKKKCWDLQKGSPLGPQQNSQVNSVVCLTLSGQHVCLSYM